MQVLQLVCKTCGKPCRSQTEKDLHTKRNPGHCEFVDQTAGAGPVDYTIEKEGTTWHTFYCTPAGVAASSSTPSRSTADLLTLRLHSQTPWTSIPSCERP